MSDRNYKCRQMFNDFLKEKEQAPKSDKTNAPPPLGYAHINDMDKPKFIEKQIAEEEVEIFTKNENTRPILLKFDEYELKWMCKDYGEMRRPEEYVRLAKSILVAFKNSSILENSVNRIDDLRIIWTFFQDERVQPSEQLFVVLNEAFNSAIRVLHCVPLERSQRKFLMDVRQAKRYLLDALLKNPDFLPDSWGRDFVLQRCRAQRELERTRRELDIVTSRGASEEWEKKRKEGGSRRGSRRAQKVPKPEIPRKPKSDVNLARKMSCENDSDREPTNNSCRRGGNNKKGKNRGTITTTTTTTTVDSDIDNPPLSPLLKKTKSRVKRIRSCRKVTLVEQTRVLKGKSSAAAADRTVEENDSTRTSTRQKSR